MTLLAGALQMTAQTTDDKYPYLVMKTGEGTTMSLAVEDLEMKVVDGQLVATNAEGTATFTLKDLSSMYFSLTKTDLVDDAIGSVLSETGEVEVFKLSGMRVGSFANRSEAQKRLLRGVYIVKQNGRISKVTVR